MSSLALPHRLRSSLRHLAAVACFSLVPAAGAALLGGCIAPGTAAGNSGEAHAGGEAASSCQEGAVSSCDALAELWGGREFVTGEPGPGMTAAAALKAGCDVKNVASACLGYALMRKSGTATGKADPEGAKPYFARLKALGDLNGFRGEPKSSLGAESLTATVKACESGRARACGQVGWAAYGAVQREKSVKDAFVAYARACELGSGNGCRWAGHFATTYPDDTGAGERARGLLQRGCEALGNAGACDELGSLESRKGSVTSAEPLFARACENGARTGCMHLGEMLSARGEGRGAELMKRACDAGEEAACKKLAPAPTAP